MSILEEIPPSAGFRPADISTIDFEPPSTIFEEPTPVDATSVTYIQGTYSTSILFEGVHKSDSVVRLGDLQMSENIFDINLVEYWYMSKSNLRIATGPVYVRMWVSVLVD